MPNPQDPHFRAVVSDHDLYCALFAQKMEAAEAAARERGERISDKDINHCASEADREAKATPFSHAATALIRGDTGPARALCERERADHGDAAADRVMQRMQAQVERTRALVQASQDARQARLRRRRPW